MTLNEESDDRSRDPDDYPSMVVRDAWRSERAFEFFDMLKNAFKQLGLADNDTYTMAYLTYSSAAKPLKERHWTIDESR